jgi:hypothetical protein
LPWTQPTTSTVEGALGTPISIASIARCWTERPSVNRRTTRLAVGADDAAFTRA